MIKILSDKDIKQIQKETWDPSQYDSMEDGPAKVVLQSIAQNFMDMSVSEFRMVLEETDAEADA